MVAPTFHTSKECHRRRTNAKKKYVVSRTKAIRRLLARTSTRHVHTVRGHYGDTPRAMSTKTAERRTKTQNKIENTRKVHNNKLSIRKLPLCAGMRSPFLRPTVSPAAWVHWCCWATIGDAPLKGVWPHLRICSNTTISTCSSARRPMCRFWSRPWSHGGPRTLSQHARESGSKKRKDTE